MVFLDLLHFGILPAKEMVKRGCQLRKESTSISLAAQPEKGTTWKKRKNEDHSISLQLQYLGSSKSAGSIPCSAVGCCSRPVRWPRSLQRLRTSRRTSTLRLWQWAFPLAKARGVGLSVAAGTRKPRKPLWGYFSQESGLAKHVGLLLVSVSKIWAISRWWFGALDLWFLWRVNVKPRGISQPPASKAQIIEGSRDGFHRKRQRPTLTRIGREWCDFLQIVSICFISGKRRIPVSSGCQN